MTEGIEGEREEEGGRPEPPGVWDRIKGLYNQTTAGDGGIREKYNEVKKIVAETIEYFVNLLIIFMLETVVIPLLGLWGLIFLGRHAVTSASWRASAGT